MVIGSDMIDIDENGNKLRYKKMPARMNEIITYAVFKNPLNHPTVALRKQFFNIVGKYNALFLKSQDYEFWIRAQEK